MVRVCANKKCTRPHHVFGCVFYTGKVLNCDDCKDKMPGIYKHCSVRMIAPSPDDSTSGLCRSCAQSVIGSAKHSYRRKNITGRHPAAPFAGVMP